MREKKKVIIYGLGIGYTRIRDYIMNQCDVVGYSVRNGDRREILGEEKNKFILPEHLTDAEFDFICITSKKYFQEIKNRLQEIIGKQNRDKIVSVYEIFGDFRNEEVRNPGQYTLNERKTAGIFVLLLQHPIKSFPPAFY